MKMKERYDAVIVGGGPAGSSAAIRLCGSGSNVLLVEQKRFPRAKLCGEFISPECVRHLDELDVTSDIRAAGAVEIFETKFFSRSGRSATIKSEWLSPAGGSAIALSRAKLDDILLERAKAAGCSVRNAAAGALSRDESGGLFLALKEDGSGTGTIHAPVFVDATGRKRALIRQVSEKFKRKIPAPAVAFKTHLTGVRIPRGVCEIYSYDGGYGGCSGIEGGKFDLCFIAASADVKRLGGDAEAVLRSVIFKNRRAAEVLKDAKFYEKWLAVPIDRFGAAEPAPVEGVFAVGDAAGFIDPFTGSGISMALESSKILAEILARSFRTGSDTASCRREYGEAYSAAFRSRLRIAALFRKAAYFPFAADRAVSILNLSERLRKTIARSTR